MKIRTQFAAALCGMVALNFAMAGYIGYRFAKSLQGGMISYLGREYAKLLAVVGERSIATHDRLMVISYINSLRLSPAVEDAYEIGPRGRIIYHVKRGVFMKAKDYESAGPNPLVFAEKFDIPFLGPGTVRVVMKPNAYYSVFNEVSQDFLPRALSFAFLALLIGFGSALLLAYFISRPIQHLLQGVREIGSGNLSVEIPISSANELGDLAAQFNDMARKLRSLDQLKDEWISKVSHDVRSPMGAVKMYADYMLHEDPERDKILPKHKEMLTIIEDNALRLNVFVSNLLDAAKMKAGRMEYHARAVDAGDVLKNVRTLYEMVARQRKIELAFDVEPGLPPMSADPEPFDRILFNLVSNALKFTNAGGKVSLSAKRAGDRIEVSVADTGKGIPKELQAHLFERFYQAAAAEQKSQAIQGTGLGLYIVKQTVEGMGGTIGVESEVGKGTRFTLRMPVRREGTHGQA